MAIAFIVLIATMPSAPPSSAAIANVAMSWTFGESFGKTGRSTTSFTARVKSRTASSYCAISVPRPFACGHDRLSSIAFTPYVAILAATRAYSSASLPYTEPITTASAARARFTSCSYSTIPGFGRPTALSRPASSSTIVGLGKPSRGSGPTLFVTTAPAPAWYTRAMEPPVSSRNPDASIVGFRSCTPAISVRRSTIGRTEMTGMLKALGGSHAGAGEYDHPGESRPPTRRPRRLDLDPSHVREELLDHWLVRRVSLRINIRVRRVERPATVRTPLRAQEIERRDEPVVAGGSQRGDEVESDEEVVVIVMREVDPPPRRVWVVEPQAPVEEEVDASCDRLAGAPQRGERRERPERLPGVGRSAGLVLREAVPPAVGALGRDEPVDRTRHARVLAPPEDNRGSCEVAGHAEVARLSVSETAVRVPEDVEARLECRLNPRFRARCAHLRERDEPMVRRRVLRLPQRGTIAGGHEPIEEPRDAAAVRGRLSCGEDVGIVGRASIKRDERLSANGGLDPVKEPLAVVHDVAIIPGAPFSWRPSEGLPARSQKLGPR